MNRQAATIIGLTAAIISLSACNVVDVVRYDPTVVVTDVRPGLTDHDDVEGVIIAAAAPCEGAACPSPPPASYPCVSGQAEGAITEGAGSVICP